MKGREREEVKDARFVSIVSGPRISEFEFVVLSADSIVIAYLRGACTHRDSDIHLFYVSSYETRAWCILTCSPITRLRLLSVGTSYTRFSLRASFPLAGEFRWRLLSRSVTETDIFQRGRTINLIYPGLSLVLKHDTRIAITIIAIPFHSDLIECTNRYLKHRENSNLRVP